VSEYHLSKGALSELLDDRVPKDFIIIHPLKLYYYPFLIVIIYSDNTNQ